MCGTDGHGGRRERAVSEHEEHPKVCPKCGADRRVQNPENRGRRVERYRVCENPECGFREKSSEFVGAPREAGLRVIEGRGSEAARELGNALCSVVTAADALSPKERARFLTLLQAVLDAVRCSGRPVVRRHLARAGA